MAQIKTVQNAKPVKGQSFKGVQKVTVPDQSLTPAEMLDKFSRGVPIVDNTRAIYYNPDDYTPDYSSLDLTEIDEIMRDAKQTIKIHNDNLKKIEDAKKSREQRNSEQKENKETKNTSAT